MPGFDGAFSIYTGKKLLPLYKPEKADELPVNLIPGITYERGRVLGQITAAVNDVQTLTTTGVPTGGTITVRAYEPYGGGSGTFVLAYNSTAAAAQTAIRAVMGPHITVTGGALPTGLVFTASGSFVSLPIDLMTIETNGLTGGTASAAAVAHTTIGANKGMHGKYDDTAVNGLQTAKCINAYEVTVDGGGNVYFGASSSQNVAGETIPAATSYVSGYFDTKELVGLDAAAVADMGRLVRGVLADGVLEF